MLTLDPEDSLDFLRTARMATYVFLISGPTLHLWFNFISKLFPKKDVVNTLKKMALGQAVYGPIMKSVFFSYNAGLQGETLPEIIARLKRDLVPAITSGLLYWPTCDLITFKFVPVHLQMSTTTWSLRSLKWMASPAASFQPLLPASAPG
uniref:PXMP2/4 family protein 4 n=1 Tax=Zea mays TaxID=4577 RepID=A0A804N646_MAIZE